MAKTTAPLQAAEKLGIDTNLQGFVTGHDFSRAANAAKRTWALAPAKLYFAPKSNSGLFPQPVYARIGAA
jgi:hypothetical protein